MRRENERGGKRNGKREDRKTEEVKDGQEREEKDNR